MKKKSLISLILNIAIVIFTVLAIGKFFVSKGDANMQVNGWASMRFFTNLSNVLVALTALCVIPAQLKNLKTGEENLPKSVFLFKFVGTVSVTVTFLTCVFFLGPTSVISGAAMGQGIQLSRYFNFFKGNTFFLHFFTPMLSVISVVFFERMENFTKKQAWLGLLPTVVYSFIYFYEVVLVGWKNGGWYDFYGFTFGGNVKMAPVSALMMYAATLVIALAERKLNRKVQG